VASCTAKGPGLCLWLVAILFAVPVHADPFFVRVYGRTYKVDPRYSSDELKSLKPREAIGALPPDLAKGPGFRPSHEQVLAEVEERVWVARHQLDNALEKTVTQETGNDRSNPQEFMERLATGAAQARSPGLQQLYNHHRALSLLVRELRRSMDLPVRTPDSGFSLPKLSPEIEASYRSLSFDPLEAYYSFRRIKAAFRSGDMQILARVAHYPLAVTGKVRRSIRTHDQLVAAKDVVMTPRLQEAVARSTFETLFVRDKGMMLGEGAVWITHDRTGFGVGAINLE
jgi:hypothetical protein